MYQSLSEHDGVSISPDHKWVYGNHHNRDTAKCKYCGLKAEYTIYDVVCYGDLPIERFKWAYHISERDEDIDPETCGVIIKTRILNFIKRIKRIKRIMIWRR